MGEGFDADEAARDLVESMRYGDPEERAAEALRTAQQHGAEQMRQVVLDMDSLDAQWADVAMGHTKHEWESNLRRDIQDLDASVVLGSDDQEDAEDA